MTDRDLLLQYQRDASADAFAQLVRRNAAMVWSAAMRQLADPHLAQDVTQAAFALLAKKPAGVRGSVAAWLMQTTRFIAGDARRQRVRRQYHERQAGAMRPQETTTQEPAWETYAPLLDDAIARLKSRDREAVILRFMRGLSLREVGQALGLTEDSARKCVQRSVDRLRKMLSAQTAAPSAAILATHLTSRAVEAPPQHLLEALGKAASLKHPISHLILWTKAKIAAVILIGLGLAGGGALVAEQIAQTKPSSPPPLPVLLTLAATQPQNAQPPDTENQMESQVPGDIQVVRWDMLLNQAGADAVNKVGQPVPSKSNLYQAMTCNGFEMRQAMADAITNNGVEQTSHNIAFGQPWNGQGQWMVEQLNFNFYYDKNRNAVRMNGAASEMQETFLSEPDGHLRINLSDTLANVSIIEGIHTSALKTNPSIQYEGDLAPGDAVAFMAPLTAPSNTVCYQLTVWETFKATPQIAPYVALERDAGWWCRNGPAKLRSWATAATIWESQASHSADDTPADFVQKLSDGKELKLVGLCRPDVAPWCWWDAQGNPVFGVPKTGVYFDGDPIKGLWVALEVTGDDTEDQLQSPATQSAPDRNAGIGQNQNYKRFDFHQIEEGAAEINVGAVVRPWQELAQLNVGVSQQVEGATYKIDNLQRPGKNDFRVRFTHPMDSNRVLALTAVGPDGKEINASENNWPLFSYQVSRAGPRTTMVEFQGIEMADIQYFRLSQRTRQWIAFTNFATQPSTPLPTQ